MFTKAPRQTSASDTRTGSRTFKGGVAAQDIGPEPDPGGEWVDANGEEGDGAAPAEYDAEDADGEEEARSW
jgi:hypothetical protein